MKIFSDLNENKNLSLALGYFDGVHLGHRSVINQAVNAARQNNAKSAVITFKDHPCCYFWGVCPKYILTRDERRNKIEELGIDYLYELDFEKISKLTGEEYIKDVLVKYFSPIAITTGFNHNFGLDKTGNTTLLGVMADKYNYKYFMQNAELFEGETISSTNIRKLLSQGNIQKANGMLGYNFPITGIVVEGQKLGRTIGFRTANIIYPPELIDLPYGVYSVNVFVHNKKYKGMTNFGIRPTVSDTHIATLETHILDFDEDIYGETIRIEFIAKIRDEQKFNSLDELKAQIKKDLALATY